MVNYWNRMKGWGGIIMRYRVKGENGWEDMNKVININRRSINYNIK
jgi:hypothetical protein